MAQLIAMAKETAAIVERLNMYIPGETFQARSAREEKLWEQLGDVIKFPCADGYAFYRVASEKPLKLQHLPVWDAWQVQPALIRGLRLDEVKHMMARERSLRELFRAKQEA